MVVHSGPKVLRPKVEQGCVQKCFGVEGIVVETASSNKEKPEMSLIGLKRPRAVRAMILKIRDQHGLAPGPATSVNAQATGGYGFNPLLPQAASADTKQLEVLVTQQHQTMVEIKDVLQDMKTALVSMNDKMSRREANPTDDAAELQ